jgi:undecaprenyldiphospho-muramoylpentapeptide beta-N-acetylglucosaminyltransferase
MADRLQKRTTRSAGRRPFVITGGGTAGHTNPGIAVAEALVDGGLTRNDVHFIGGARGNEGALVGDAGFTIDLLPGRGIQRKLTPANIGSVLGLLAGFVKGFGIVVKRKPRAVLCLGGYAAFAASAAAVLLRIPLVISEQNARASAVNRLFGRFASVCALPFPDTDLPKGVLTGNPIRSSIVIAVGGADRQAARDGLESRYNSAQPESQSGSQSVSLGSRVLVAVWAGSLGATRINEAVQELSRLWVDRADVAIYHVIGKRDWDRFAVPSPGADAAGLLYLTVEYENNMPDLLVGADIAICRAGASTVTELAVAGLPAVLVPLPAAPRDHQRANTAEIERAGGAIVADDQDVTGQALAEILEPIIADSSRRAEMAAAASSVARPNAAPDVASLLMEAGGLGSTAAGDTGG